MSDLDNAINSINASAAKAENTATFLDDMSTFDDQSSVTNPNNGQTVASIPKQVKDRTDELFSAAESDINQAVSDAAQSATDAQDAADSIGRYQGLWPDTDGSADKGDTYQTQVSGTPTGKYFTALQNTTAEPIGDDVNWREVVSNQSLGGATNYQAASVADMVAGITINGIVDHKVGHVWVVNQSEFKVVTVSDPITLNDFSATNGVYADAYAGGLSEALDSAVDGSVIYLSKKNYNIVGKYKLGTSPNVGFVGNEKRYLTIIGAGMPEVTPTYSGLVEGTGTAIQGSLINFADGFQCYNLGIDCGKNVVDGLSAGEYLEGFVPGTHKLDSVWSDYDSYIKDVHFGNIRVLMKEATADVSTHKHAALVEHINGGTQGYIETIGGLHGYVLKSKNIVATAPVVSRLSTGESVFMKSDSYTQCSGLVGGEFKIGSSQDDRVPPVICNASNSVDIEDMEFNVIAENVTAALIGSGSGSLKRFNVGSVKCNDSTTTPVVIPLQAQRWTLDSWNIVNSDNNGIEVVNGSVAVHLGDGAVYDCVGDGYSLDGISSHGSLRAENCGGWAVFNNGGRSIVNPATVTSVNCTSGAISELYKAEPLVLLNGWSDSAPLGYEFSLSVIGSTIQVSGQIGGSPTTSIFMTVPVGYRPSGIRRFPVYVNGSTKGEHVGFITFDPSNSSLSFSDFSEITGGNTGIELSTVSWVIDN